MRREFDEAVVLVVVRFEYSYSLPFLFLPLSAVTGNAVRHELGGFKRRGITLSFNIFSNCSSFWVWYLLYHVRYSGGVVIDTLRI